MMGSGERILVRLGVFLIRFSAVLNVISSLASMRQ